MSEVEITLYQCGHPLRAADPYSPVITQTVELRDVTVYSPEKAAVAKAPGSITVRPAGKDMRYAICYPATAGAPEVPGFDQLFLCKGLLGSAFTVDVPREGLVVKPQYSSDGDGVLYIKIEP